MLLGRLPAHRFPVYLHTQPESYRAVNLYSDLGFAIVVGDLPGPRPNDAAAAIDELRRVMPRRHFARLRTVAPPRHLVDVLERHATVEF